MSAISPMSGSAVLASPPPRIVLGYFPEKDAARGSPPAP
eukprot:CAMPEP_0180403058 /NCGR_PEP_ID=MMETSP0989-20121125/39218_1 /TAXON_ID=697907 /ORGANISM="non described non described, Strain CCMP2293" /LENGTH=38 /DNA_ID= /DNA_START= /DNA_END= /DNA_ORIENTATION=